MNTEKLIKKHPRLWHMAQDGSWPSISEHGLLSTSSLLDLYKIEGQKRLDLESRHRPKSVAISCPGLPGAVVRDQKPMKEHELAGSLDDGLAPSDWYEILNARVFFWPCNRRLRGLLGAVSYRKDVQTVLTLDTATIVAAYADVIQLSPINSGSTIQTIARRGLKTFASISDFPLEPHRQGPGKYQKVAEVVIPDRVVPIDDHVLAVHRVKKDQIIEELWRSPRAKPDDGPFMMPK